jgi:hypothetical protein
MSHLPPAFSQSAFVRYCEKSVTLLDGLAEGELDELPDPPVVPLPVEVPEPVLPVVPEGPLDPDVPDVPLPLPLLPVCAAASAGTRATTATKNTSISFCIVRVLPLSNLPAGVALLRAALRNSNIQALDSASTDVRR